MLANLFRLRTRSCFLAGASRGLATTGIWMRGEGGGGGATDVCGRSWAVRSVRSRRFTGSKSMGEEGWVRPRRCMSVSTEGLGGQSIVWEDINTRNRDARKDEGVLQRPDETSSTTTATGTGAPSSPLGESADTTLQEGQPGADHDRAAGMMDDIDPEAVTLAKMELPERVYRTLFVGGIPYTTKPYELESLFSAFGAVDFVRMPRNKRNLTRGYAHVRFVNDADAVAAYESSLQEMFMLGDRPLLVEYAQTLPDNSGQILKDYRKLARPNSTLYFTSFTGTEEELKEAFSDFKADIRHIMFLRDHRTQRWLGRGLVRMSSVEVAMVALEALSGELELSFAQPAWKLRKQARDALL
ncbi:hypothetical protein AMATHDRAFT_51561 [Amanita thiersii Skay4041]|uniref:RRM domain-containing protein n=1 Tax=Amanita thiersii Skay4041 TaxID=703135 RepID=A0A2A9NCX0_9AGAR|nr:hypothetical protein AMATHDRAFT_51561 [Amanita thiersii Skay4041]